jgi:5-methylcytosine-specific restriction protein B
MSRFCGERQVSEILAAGEHWRDTALVGARSIFSGEDVWITANIEVLDSVFTQNPDEGDRHFIPKLHDQLKPCSAAVKQLAAEFMWLLMLSPSNISPDKKRENIKTIWDWSERPFPDKSKWLSDDVLRGIGSGGPGFSNHRPRELAFCLNVLLALRKLTTNEQAALVKEPWNFATWLQQVPDAQARQFRHMLLYLLFPDEFERIFSAGDRKAIVGHFAGLSRSQANGMLAVDIDKVLRQTRADLEQKYKTSELDFYHSPLKELWQSNLTELEAALTADHVKAALVEIDKEGVPADAVSSTYDLVDGDKQYPPKFVLSLALKHATGKELSRHEFSGGEDTWAFRVLRQLGFSIVPKKFIADLVERFLAQANGGQDLRTSDYPKEYRGLQVKVGFGQGVFSRVPWIAFLGQGQKVSGGIYPVLLYYREARVLILAYGVSETNVPTLEWNGLDQPRTVASYLRQKHSRDPERYGDSFVDVAFEVPDRLDLDQLAVRLDRMISSYQSQLQASAVVSTAPEEVAPSVVAIDDAIKDLFVDKDRFELLLDQLGKKKNIILQGPPGVGKTFFAQRLAQVFAGKR